MEEGAKRKLTVDLEDLAGAFENGFPDLHYYLDLETGEVAMVSDETRGDLEAIYEDLAGGEDLDDAVVAAAIGQREVPDWQKELLLEADRVERGYETRFVEIPRDETHEAYRDMEEFIPTVADRRLRERLYDAIDGHGAFGRFKQVLSSHDEVRERWFVFRDARLRERIVAWLAEEGFEPIL
jgi:hypothetical protein